MPEEIKTGTFRRIRLFADSNSDFMDWPIPILAVALDSIRQAPNLDVLLLTKWPELFQSRLDEAQKRVMDKEGAIYPETPENELWWWLENWKTSAQVPAHIIIMTSVLDQKSADRRIPHLLQIPAARHGLSVEPLWASVDLDRWFDPCTSKCGPTIGSPPLRGHFHHHNIEVPKPGWVIVGCDSSTKHKGWENYEANARSVIHQCKSAGVPVYHKQMPVNGRVSLGMNQWPEDLRVRQFYR